MFERYTIRQWSQPFCNRGPVNAWQFYRGREVLYGGCSFSSAEMKVSVWAIR